MALRVAFALVAFEDLGYVCLTQLIAWSWYHSIRSMVSNASGS